MACTQALFAAQGLPGLALPAHLTAALLPVGEHILSTRKLAHPLYRLDAWFEAVWRGTESDYAAIGFDGHGMNSWAAHFYLVHGPAAMFLQCRWGNAFDDTVRARERMEGIFGLAGQLLEDLDSAQRTGCLTAGQRLVLRVSDFSRSGWGWAGQPQSWHEDGDFSLLEAIGAVNDLGIARE
jgi:hypothetical protein